MGTAAQNLVRDILRFQVVDLPLEVRYESSG